MTGTVVGSEIGKYVREYDNLATLIRPYVRATDTLYLIKVFEVLQNNRVLVGTA